MKAQIAPNLGEAAKYAILSGGIVTANLPVYVTGKVGAVNTVMYPIV